MITLAESGLTDQEYTAFQSLETGHAFKVVAERYNLDFSNVNSSGAFESVTASTPFTVFQYNGGLYRMFSNCTDMEKFDTATSTWSALTDANPHTYSYTFEYSPPAVILGGRGIRVFWATSDGIKTNSYSITYTGGNWTFDDANTGLTAILAGDQFQSYYEYPMLVPATATFTASTTLENYVVGNLFDGSTGRIWAATTSTGWVRTYRASGMNVFKYTIVGRASGFTKQNPKSWTIEYSDNGTSWTTAHTVSNVTNWIPLERKTYEITSRPASSKLYWRINISANNGDSYLAMTDLEWYDITTINFGNYSHIAAFDPTIEELVVIRQNLTKKVYSPQLLKLENGTWQLYSYSPWLTFPPDSLSAAAIGDERLIMISTETPGTMTVVNDENLPVNYVYPSEAVITFKFINNRSTDHFVVDSVDQITDWRWRGTSKVHALNGTYVATVYSGDGTKEYPIEGYRFFTSKDGENWSNGNWMPCEDSVSGYGLQLLQSGGDLYAFEATNVFKSDATPYIGYPNEANQFDLTPYMAGYEFDHDGAFQSAIVLDNSDGTFDNHAVINLNHTVCLKHYAGFYINGEKKLIQIAITYLDSMEESMSLPDGGESTLSVVKLTCRDNLARFSEYVVSEQARYWKTQIVGADNYLDVRNNNYGGLAHTSTVLGAHKTQLGWLSCDADDEECVAFATFASDIWNGAVSVGFRLSQTAGAPTTQKAGVVFRAYDKSNFWYAVYREDTDKIYLYVRQNGTDTNVFMSSSVMGWTAHGVTRYIRVEFRYGTIYVFSSSDSNSITPNGGVFWDQVGSYLMDCSIRSFAADLRPLSETVLERGYVGTFGKGKR